MTNSNMFLVYIWLKTKYPVMHPKEQKSFVAKKESAPFGADSFYEFAFTTASIFPRT